MQTSINKIISLASSIEISYLQSLYLWSLRYDPYTSVIIDKISLVKLTELDLVKSNKLTQLGNNLLDKIENSNPNTTEEKSSIVDNKLPKLSKDSGEIVKELAGIFLKNKLNSKEIERIQAYTKNDFQVPFLFLFLELFPTSENSKNKDWNEHFQFEWDNVTLRRLTRGTVNKFQSIWKTKDIGIFLFGTYLFIRESRNDSNGKYFIKNIENYFKEYDFWYNTAEDRLTKEVIKDQKINKDNYSNTNIL